MIYFEFLFPLEVDSLFEMDDETITTSIVILVSKFSSRPIYLSFSTVFLEMMRLMFYSVQYDVSMFTFIHSLLCILFLITVHRYVP